MRNILTIDWEDWYQDIEIKYWDKCEDRIVENTTKLLNLLNETNTHATFFILAYNAKKFPKLVEEIRSEGHEIGVHGFFHTNLLNQTPAEFEKELIKSMKIIEKLSRVKIAGYSAPQFSIIMKTSWPIKILKKNKIKYDSSIFPVSTLLHGIPNAPRFSYHVSSFDIRVEDKNEDFLELPISTYRLSIFKKNIPIGGGFYLRLFPYNFIKYVIKKINKENQPAIFYFHPWELDPKQPKIRSYNISYNWYRYHNLKKSEKRLRKLLKDFRFTSIKKFLIHNWRKNCL